MIGGCARLDGVTDAKRQQQWQTHQQSLATLDSWDLHARAAIRIESAAYNIGIRWQRDSDRFSLLLEAPFGQGVFRISDVDGGRYRLQLPDGQAFENSTPEALLQDVVGWSLPVSGLEYWIRGLPRPDSGYSHRLDGAGRARSIAQDQWSIDYLDYFDPDAQRQLPRKINLSREAMNMRLVIERWQQVRIEDTGVDIFPDFN